MTKEEKQLLLKDLCARLLYHPRINICNDSWEGCQIGEFDTNLYSHHIDAFVCDRIEIKPYLRPIDSMTEEEKKEYCDLQAKFLYSSRYPVTDAYELFDWLNAHHLDYRGLIPMGLALEAKEDMYKTE
jgi:hypothetical protein